MDGKRALMIPLLAIAALVAASCGSGAATPSPAATTVTVTLQEWAVVPSVVTARSGQITFAITNQGPNDVHEFVVLKTDLSVHALPTDGDGAVNEEGGGMEVIDEIEDILVGQTEQLTVNLAPGNYALICNIYSAEEDEAHYQMGMRTAFSVTQ
jgi:uncharacterized cupredoxin-like copper-binding protein